MCIKLLHNDRVVDVNFNKIGEVYEAEYQWDVGEEYALEIDTSTLGGAGVSLRLLGAPEAHHIEEVTESEDPLDVAPQLDEIWPDEDLPHPANAETTEKFTTIGSTYSFKITAGWGESRFVLRFRPRKWSREYVLRRV